MRALPRRKKRGCAKNRRQDCVGPAHQARNRRNVEHTTKSFQGKAGMMSPKGGSFASDDEVKAAVDYMVASSK